MSGRQDLNLRPSEPHSDALARLRHAPNLGGRSVYSQHLLSMPNYTPLCNGHFGGLSYFDTKLGTMVMDRSESSRKIFI